MPVVYVHVGQSASLGLFTHLTEYRILCSPSYGILHIQWKCKSYTKAWSEYIEMETRHSITCHEGEPTWRLFQTWDNLKGISNVRQLEWHFTCEAISDKQINDCPNSQTNVIILVSAGLAGSCVSHLAGLTREAKANHQEGVRSNHNTSTDH